MAPQGHTNGHSSNAHTLCDNALPPISGLCLLDYRPLQLQTAIHLALGHLLGSDIDGAFIIRACRAWLVSYCGWSAFRLSSKHSPLRPSDTLAITSHQEAHLKARHVFVSYRWCLSSSTLWRNVFKCRGRLRGGVESNISGDVSRRPAGGARGGAGQYEGAGRF